MKDDFPGYFVVLYVVQCIWISLYIVDICHTYKRRNHGNVLRNHGNVIRNHGNVLYISVQLEIRCTSRSRVIRW